VRYVEELRAILDSSSQQHRQAALKWGGNVDHRTAHKTIAEQYINADTHIASASQRHNRPLLLLWRRRGSLSFIRNFILVACFV
jgi:hypothetical protein